MMCLRTHTSLPLQRVGTIASFLITTSVCNMALPPSSCGQTHHLAYATPVVNHGDATAVRMTLALWNGSASVLRGTVSSRRHRASAHTRSH